MGDRLGPPIDVRSVLELERAALLDLLAELEPADWAQPTACPGWTVHDVAVHLVHDDLRRLSAQRDGHPGAWVDASTFDDLVEGLARTNEGWVEQVAPSLSPRLVIEALGWLAAPTAAHLAGLPPDEEGDRVTWAGPGPHPNWLDVAREYTERFVHQQQIRDAVGRPGLTQWRFVGPVVDTFLRALPAVLPDRPVGTALVVEVPGAVAEVPGAVARGSDEVAQHWAVAVGSSGWGFVPRVTTLDVTTVHIGAGPLWRRAVRMLDADAVRAAAQVSGDRGLADAVLDLRAAIVTDAPRGNEGGDRAG